jgi:hypothetical protein
VTNAVLCSLIALLSLRYLAGVGPVPELIAANHFKNPWLVVHVGCAATALLVGPLQLVPSLRHRAPACHRWRGRVYVLGSSLPLAFVSGYRVVSFLCWVPNLLAAELSLRRNRDKTAVVAAA